MITKGTLKTKHYFLVFIFIFFLTMGVFFITPTWYKVQIKILPNKVHGKDLFKNLSLLSSILKTKPQSLSTDLFIFLQSKINIPSFSRKLILNEFNDWEKQFSIPDRYSNYESKLNYLVHEFQNNYLDIFEIPKNGLIIIEVRIPNDINLCTRTAQKVSKYTEELMLDHHKKNLSNQLKHLKKAQLYLTSTLDSVETEITKLAEKNKQVSTPRMSIVFDRLNSEKELYRSLLEELDKNSSVFELELESEQHSFRILEDSIHPVMKYHPYRNWIYSLLFLEFLSFIIILGIKKSSRTLI